MRTRRTPCFARCLPLACGMLALAACSAGTSSECLTTCKRLSACGFTPSLLAPKSETKDDLIESCAERCTVSESDLVEGIHACTAVVRPGSPALWCNTSSSGKGSMCQQASTCLKGLVEEHVPIVGVTDVRLETRLRQTTGQVVTMTEPQECALPKEDLLDEPAVLATAGLCDQLGVDSMRYFVVHDGVRHEIAYDSCAAGLERGASFTLEPGPLTAGIELEGTALREVMRDGRLQTERVKACVTYYAERRLLGADVLEEVPIYINENIRPPLLESGCTQE